MKILIFEDEYLHDENVTFRLAVKEELQKVIVKYAGSIEWFEKHIKQSNTKFTVFVLDIMAAEVDLIGIESNERIESVEIGIELLKRIRNGYYGNENKNSLIIMRTARASDPRIYNECKRLGANYCFDPTGDDLDIIDIIKKYKSNT